MSYVAIRSAIKTKLDALVTAGSIGVIFNGRPSPQTIEIPAWPAVVLTRIANTTDYFTNREDMQTYHFEINIYQQLEETNWGDVEVSLDATLDAIMQKFLDDVQLGGVVDGRIHPVENPSADLEWQGRLVRREQIILQCPKIKSMP